MTTNNFNIFGENTTLYLNNGATVQATGKRNSGHCKPVMCKTDGKFYTSLTDMVEHVGGSYAAACAHMNGKRKTFKGKKYVYLVNRDDGLDAMAENLRILSEANEALEADAMKWREYQAQLEAERKAKEKHEKAIAKTKERIEKHELKLMGLEAKIVAENELIQTLKEELAQLEAETI